MKDLETMKIIVLFLPILIFELLTTTINSQDYWQIIDSTSKWSIITSDYDDKDLTLNIRIGTDDTLIGGLAYRKVYRTYDPDEQFWSFIDLLIREDIVNKQVFLRNLIGEEGLIYDFSLGVGDTVSIKNILAL
ncbi:MAG: hypothetical protein R2764_23030 [Bacteroidales bacterium]